MISKKQQEKCECVCHTIIEVKRGDAFIRQFDRPVNCKHCTRETNN